MICVTKLPNGLDIGGFVIRGAMIGHESHQTLNAPGRERIGGYEVTRNVPDDIWNRWFGDNSRGEIIRLKMVAGFPDGDDDALNAFCWANSRVRGWRQATQDASSL